MTSVPPIDERRHLVLVGLMGAGKTSVGRLLAKQLKMDFTDADAEIEKAAGMTIPEIFRIHGERVFRDGERRVIARLLESTPGVLATGGGAFMDAETRIKVRQHGISVWLRAEVDVLYERVRRRVGRPLLETENPQETLRQLARIRYPIYAEADITVETGREKPRETVHRIIEELNKMTAQTDPARSDA